MLIVFMGPSASGKDTLQKKLIEDFNTEKIITYTTRTMRPGETNDVDYHFISNRYFKELAADNFFAETAEYSGGRLYGSGLNDIVEASKSDKLYTIILTPAGFRNIKKYVNENDIYSVLVNAPLKDRVIRYIDRCKDEFDYSDLTEIQERVNRDFGMFLSVENEVDLTYENIASKDFENDIQKAVTDIVSNTLNKNFSLDAKKKLHEAQKENNTLVIPEGTKSVTKRLIDNLLKEKNTKMKDITNVLIPDSVTSIEDGAFAHYAGLKSVTIPDSVISIGNSVFIRCTNLESVKLPNELQNIKKYTFAACQSLTSIEIPNRVSSIEDYAFGNCKKLENIKIPDGVTSIGTEAFYECKNLSHVKLECDISAISDINVFNNCYEDMEIELKDGTVISINELEDILDNRMSNKDEEDYDRE